MHKNLDNHLHADMTKALEAHQTTTRTLNMLTEALSYISTKYYPSTAEEVLNAARADMVDTRQTLDSKLRETFDALRLDLLNDPASFASSLFFMLDGPS